jgi:hypothetical protein
MNTPMIGFRLDPKLTAMMDARCQELGQSRAEWLRGLIVAQVGSPVSIDINELARNVADLDLRLGAQGESIEGLARRVQIVQERLGIAYFG